ncbi:MAG TPA: hypothetical protein VH092_21425 [Urbifossiella sp.]|jgi:hypothetical protein|nr:hypothetical protein [Urbifossiella sp.]
MPLSITCPGCREPLDVDEEYRTWKVRCPRCETEFVPDDRRPAGPPDRPPPRPRRDRDGEGDEDDDDYDDRPRRRRRRRFTREVYDRAAAEVYGPAICLELLGWLGILATLGGVAALVAVGAAANAPGGPKNNDDAAGIIVCGICCGVFGLPYSLGLTVAGRHLRRLTSRGWATAGAVFGIGGFFLVQLLVFHLAAGIWVLVVINQPHVRAAFDYQARYGGPPEYDD